MGWYANRPGDDLFDPRPALDQTDADRRGREFVLLRQFALRKAFQLQRADNVRLVPAFGGVRLVLHNRRKRTRINSLANANLRQWLSSTNKCVYWEPRHGGHLYFCGGAV